MFAGEIRSHLSRDWMPKAVLFRHAAPPVNLALHRAAFGSDLRFNQDRNALLIDNDTTDASLTRSFELMLSGVTGVSGSATVSMVRRRVAAHPFGAVATSVTACELPGWQKLRPLQLSGVGTYQIGFQGATAQGFAVMARLHLFSRLIPIIFQGQLCCSNRARQGLLLDAS